MEMSPIGQHMWTEDSGEDHTSWRKKKCVWKSERLKVEREERADQWSMRSYRWWMLWRDLGGFEQEDLEVFSDRYELFVRREVERLDPRSSLVIRCRYGLYPDPEHLNGRYITMTFEKLGARIGRLSDGKPMTGGRANQVFNKVLRVLRQRCRWELREFRRLADFRWSIEKLDTVVEG